VSVELVPGLPKRFRKQATEVFWDGFSDKLTHALGPEVDAKEFLSQTFAPSAVTLAVEQRQVLGVLAVSDREHPLLSDTWAAARDVYGHTQGMWRLLLMVPMTVSPHKNTLYIEYVAVARAARGKGIGSLLMEHAEDIARARGLSGLELDVVDTNPRARGLYERMGYRLEKTSKMGPLSSVYNFDASHLMMKQLSTAMGSGSSDG
jgi:ribosomal protein S18 acetylase RimI-like enzyme